MYFVYTVPYKYNYEVPIRDLLKKKFQSEFFLLWSESLLLFLASKFWVSPSLPKVLLPIPPVFFILFSTFLFETIFLGDFLLFFSYYIQHCFICRPSDSTVPTEDAGSNPGPLQLVHWQSDVLTTRLDLIRPRLDLIRTRIDLIRSRQDLIRLG
jgi:hypothetical protein